MLIRLKQRFFIFGIFFSFFFFLESITKISLVMRSFENESSLLLSLTRYSLHAIFSVKPTKIKKGKKRAKGRERQHSGKFTPPVCCSREAKCHLPVDPLFGIIGNSSFNFRSLLSCFPYLSFFLFLPFSLSVFVYLSIFLNTFVIRPRTTGDSRVDWMSVVTDIH